MARNSGHSTAMAGEFFVMERLFRLGHEPALTLGNAKTIDIIVKTKSDRLQTVSVKAVCGGGKWPVDGEDVSKRKDLVYVFLRYRRFKDVTTDPDVYVIPARTVQKLKRPWFKKPALYYSHPEHAPRSLKRYKDAWKYIA